MSNFFWTNREIEQLCDLIADGHNFTAAARIMGKSRGAVIGQFARIRAKYGEQGQ